jgi:hypothetical protein
VYFPELSLPADFDATKIEAWTKQIARPRLRTIVSRGVEAALAQAVDGT